MQPVTLTVNGSNCTISNGILSMFWKEDGTLGSLSKNGTELICNLPERSDTGGRTAFYVDYHAEGVFRKYHAPDLKVIEATPQMAHIAYTDATGYLAIEYHIILMQGESGYYSYVCAANNVDVPFELSEFRIVYRSGSRIFDHACNSERFGLQPTHKYMEQYEKLQDETYRLPDGEKYTNGDVYSKYDYAGYFSKNPAWGQYGHGYGFFVIPVSTEYYPGGPLKQELLVHYDGIVLNYFTGSHFGTGNLHVPIGWKKLYGPFYQYFNEGNDPELLYRDALRVAEAEQKKWPYQWVKEPLYPLIRSRVTGQLLFHDGTPCSNATVILGQKGLPVERQSADYLFYTETDQNGRFVLKNVRFGRYSLFAYQTGGSNTEQLQIDDLSIRKEEESLGVLRWQLPDEKILWQLGKATRTCEGYRFGGELRNYKWMGMVPETVDFYIGENKEATDWFYAQTRTGSWYVHFYLEELPVRECSLIVALAGACRGDVLPKELPSLSVLLNGRLLQNTVLAGDSAVTRSSTTSGRYRRLRLKVDPALLQKGKNTVELLNNGGMIMYDTLLLTESLSQSTVPRP